MNSQSVFEKLVYWAIGLIFFMGYYFFMSDYLNRDPFSGGFLLLTLYFVMAIITFPKSGNKLSKIIDVPGLNANILMPLAYLLAPIVYLIWEIKNN